MPRSTRLLGLLALLFVPTGANAQQMATTTFGWPRLSVTPFIGFRVGYDRDHDEIVRGEGGEVLVASRTESEVEGAPVFGVEIDGRVAGPLSIQAAIGFDPASDATVSSHATNGLQVYRAETASSWFGKAGVGIWLREPDPDSRLHRPTANIFAGVAARRIEPNDFANIEGDFEDPYTTWGANLGFKGETPIWNRLVFQFAAEDYWTFWNDEKIARATEAVFLAEGTPVSVEVSQDASHLVVLRAGLSIRF